MGRLALNQTEVLFKNQHTAHCPAPARNVGCLSHHLVKAFSEQTNVLPFFPFVLWYLENAPLAAKLNKHFSLGSLVGLVDTGEVGMHDIVVSVIQATNRYGIKITFAMH